MSNKAGSATLDLGLPSSSVETGAARRVLVPYPVDKAYDYVLPQGWRLRTAIMCACRWASVKFQAWSGARRKGRSRRKNSRP
jgi:hypothetical protein